MTDTHLWTRLLHSLSLVAVGMSIAYETWPPVGWHNLFIIDWSKYGLGLTQSYWIVGLCDQWEAVLLCVCFECISYGQQYSCHDPPFPKNVTDSHKPIVLQCCLEFVIVIDLTTHLLSIEHPDWSKSSHVPALWCHDQQSKHGDVVDLSRMTCHVYRRKLVTKMQSKHGEIGIHYNGWNYLSMLGSKSIDISKGVPGLLKLLIL